MKRKYIKPVAEIIVFHYVENVVACSEYCPWFGCYHLPNTPTPTQVPQSTPQPSGSGTGSSGGGGGSDNSNPYWECKSPDYWGC